MPESEQQSQSAVHVIIPAGGLGTRMGLPYPKQLLSFGNTTVIAHAVGLFHPNPTVVAVPTAYREAFRQALPQEVMLVDGGATRYESVKRAFEALPHLDRDDLVVIHDAARPFFDPSQLEPACEMAREKGAVIFASRATDTVKLAGEDGGIAETLNRDRIYLAQTPQIFKAGLLRTAYAQADGKDCPTDEAALLESKGMDVFLFPSSTTNRKLTNPEDLRLLEPVMPCIGQGYDVHRFDETRPLYLGGICIPNAPGLLGHSDADVLLHALIDALLGAAGLGDIGQWFPDNDPRFAGIRSTVLLERVMETLVEKGFRLGNADVTVMAQAPKLAPHIPQMRAAMAPLLRASEAQINIKATTTEGLGFVGRKEGIAAQAVVILTKGSLA